MLGEFNKHELQRFLHCNFDFNTLYWQSSQKMVHVASYLTNHYHVSCNTTLNLRHSFFMTALVDGVIAVIRKVKYDARGRSEERQCPMHGTLKHATHVILQYDDTTNRVQMGQLS